jgi:protein O-GlcNAc transferase
LTPQELNTLLRQAQSLHQAGRLAEAERDYLVIAGFAAGNAEIWHLLGVIAYQQGNFGPAIERYRKATELRVDFPQAQNNLAIALKATGQMDSAAAAFAAALDTKPDYAEAAYNLALLHEAKGASGPAEKAYRQALDVKPDWLEPLGNLGNLLRRERRLAEAEPFLQRAMSLRSDDATAVGNLALLRIDQGRLLEGRTLAQRAASLAPHAGQWWEAAGTAARLMKDFDSAVPLLKRAAELSPRDAALWYELGLAHEASADDAEARNALARALELAPRWERLRWSEALLLPRIPGDDAGIEDALRRFDAGLARIDEGLRLDSPEERAAALDAASSVIPFNLHYLPGDHTSLQCRFANLVAKAVRAALPEFAVTPPVRPRTDSPMRVGFVGSHLREHVVERFFAAFITGLDPAAFERWVWSASDAGDARTEAIAASVEHFARGESTLEKLAADIRAADLDVLVYLDAGLDARTGALAALRLAPIQVACCGHPVTTGLDSIDHFLSGKLLEPPGAQAQYREKLARLPQLGSSPRAPAAPGDGRWADALRLEGKPLLMCLQNLAKLPPSFDDVLATILARSGARLVLFDRGGGTSARWRKRVDRALSAHGVSPDMLRIEPLHGYGDFLAGIARADLILDSPGFSGGATSLDALAMGAAVLCFEGASARARQTSAMLRIVEVPELIAGSAADYVERAVALLAEPHRIAALRVNIRERANRLFETAPVLEAFADFLRSCRNA